MSSNFHIARMIFTALLLSLLVGCGPPSHSPQQVKAGQPFKLSPGESAMTKNAELTITFNSVTSDSRCPSDATCIQAGEAKVSLTLQSSQGSRDVELSTTSDNSQAAYSGYVVQFVDLMPYPISTKPISPETYEVTLVVLSS
jgi:hypothetical protein